MSNMDDFFKKHYDNAEEAADGWNIPSEQVWEDAKIYFPQPKKKRKAWPFLLFGATLMVLSFAALSIYNDVSTKTNNTITTVSKTNPKETTTSTILFEQNNPVIEKLNTNQGNQLIENTSPIQESNKLINPDIASTTKVIKSTNQNPTKTNRITGPSIKTSPATINHTAHQQINTKNTNPVTAKSTDTKLTANVVIEISETNDRDKFNTDPIELTQISSFSKPISVDVEVTKPLKVTMPSYKRINEVGVSHAISVFSFGETRVDDEDDEVSLTPRYFNINMHYNKWIGHRWSLSTGLYISDINAKLNFVGYFNYDQSGASNQSINSEVKKALEQGTVNQVNDAEVSFLQGLGPTMGEALKIKGVAEIKLAAIQFPVLVNYHWVKRKVEYSLGVGAAFDFVWEEQHNVDFDIFRDDMIISQTADIADVKGSHSDFSLFVQPSFKYKISPRFNLGINLRYSVIEPVFSGLELGAYYRWSQ